MFFVNPFASPLTNCSDADPQETGLGAVPAPIPADTASSSPAVPTSAHVLNLVQSIASLSIALLSSHLLAPTENPTSPATAVAAVPYETPPVTSAPEVAAAHTNGAVAPTTAPPPAATASFFQLNS